MNTTLWAKQKTVLFTGPLSIGGTCEMRRQTLERNGASTVPVSYLPIFRSYPTVLRKAQWMLRTGPAVARYNRDLNFKLGFTGPNVLWVEKGMFVLPDVVRAAKDAGCSLIHYSPDNYFLRQNTSRHLLTTLPMFDLVVTTKPAGTKGLEEMGVQKVLLSGNAYDEQIHRPGELSNADRARYGCDVAFIGRWEPDREALLERIIERGFNVKVWGPNWAACNSPIVLNAWNGLAEREEYAKAIQGARVTLCLLSRLADDTITQRSVEIPACGGFMLAERTVDHQAHFIEGQEAEYFENDEEMFDKLTSYLRNDDARNAVAAAGRLRCERSGYSYDSRLREIITALPAYTGSSAH